MRFKQKRSPYTVFINTLLSSARVYERVLLYANALIKYFWAVCVPKAGEIMANVMTVTVKVVLKWAHNYPLYNPLISTKLWLRRNALMMSARGSFFKVRFPKHLNSFPILGKMGAHENNSVERFQFRLMCAGSFPVDSASETNAWNRKLESQIYHLESNAIIMPHGKGQVVKRRKHGAGIHHLWLYPWHQNQPHHRAWALQSEAMLLQKLLRLLPFKMPLVTRVGKLKIAFERWTQQ